MRALRAARAVPPRRRRPRGWSSRPERSPHDWTIEPPTGCDCALCRQSAAFLRDRDRTRHAWPLAEQQRRHVHGVIQGHRLPVTHTTTREGRPYTLVLTKQAALFERSKRRIGLAASRSLTWLGLQHRAFAAAPEATRSPGRDARSTSSVVRGPRERRRRQTRKSRADQSECFYRPMLKDTPHSLLHTKMCER